MGNILEEKKSSPFLLLREILIDNLVAGRLIRESPATLVDKQAMFAF